MLLLPSLDMFDVDNRAGTKFSFSVEETCINDGGRAAEAVEWNHIPVKVTPLAGQRQARVRRWDEMWWRVKVCPHVLIQNHPACLESDDRRHVVQRGVDLRKPVPGTNLERHMGGPRCGNIIRNGQSKVHKFG